MSRLVFTLALLAPLVASCSSTVAGWDVLGEDPEVGPDAGAVASTDAAALPDGEAPFVPLEISGVSVINGKIYPLIAEGAVVDMKRYIDRDYAFVELPPLLADVSFVQTANDDASTQGDTHLSFTVNKPSIVYVAHDDRKSTKPDWLSTFTDTETDLRDSDGDSNLFSIFQAEFPAGLVILGGNKVSGEDRSMYSVFIADPAL